MTPDQIRQISENSADKAIDEWKQNKTIGLRRLISDACFDAICQISARYCIVERSKVVEMYECYTQNIQASRKLGLNHAEDIAIGSCATMRDIFGSETFSKKEDEENIE